MLNIRVICVGRLKERFYLDAAAEYSKRLSRFCRLELTELPESRLPEDPSAAETIRALEAEAVSIEAKLPKSGVLVALCIEGRELSSPALAEQLNAYAVSGASAITFLIGGSVGLAERLKARADLKLSMSPMTFPHHLARIMLLEQLYRAFQIQAGTRYHK